MSSFLDRVRALDSFAKTHDDFRTKTVFGGLVTILSGAAICFLLFFEWIDYQKVSWRSELVVDQSNTEQMTINFDISFPRVPCFALTLDLMDAADQHQNNVEKDVIKTKLSSTGQSLGPFSDFHIEDIKGKDYCGDCHVLKIIDPQGNPVCCNSCSSVFAAHEHMGVPPPKMEDVEQCRLENWPDLIKNHANEGCRIAGSLRVNKVSGNFHFAPGKSFDIKGHHLHDIRLLDGLKLDFTHEIHSLSFGARHAHLKNPLDNTKVEHDSHENDTVVHSYYVKVVATDFRHLSGNIFHTNQFSVTRNSHPVSSKVPSMFVFFDISPMIVIYNEERKAITSFLTGVCAIIGGIYTIAALIDAFVFHAERRLAQKRSIGKAH